MDLQAQYKEQHSEALAAAEKLAGSLGKLGAAGTLDTEIKFGGGGVGVGFNSPYITMKISQDKSGLKNETDVAINNILTQVSKPENMLANTIAGVFNTHLSEAQNMGTSAVVRANGDSININLDALSTGLRNNPQIETVMENMGSLVQQTVAQQINQQRGGVAPKQAAAQPNESQLRKQERPVPGSNPKPDEPPMRTSKWAKNIQDERAQSEGQGHSR